VIDELAVGTARIGVYQPVLERKQAAESLGHGEGAHRTDAERAGELIGYEARVRRAREQQSRGGRDALFDETIHAITPFAQLKERTCISSIGNAERFQSSRAKK